MVSIWVRTRPRARTRDRVEARDRLKAKARDGLWQGLGLGLRLGLGLELELELISRQLGVCTWRRRSDGPGRKPLLFNDC